MRLGQCLAILLFVVSVSSWADTTKPAPLFDLPGMTNEVSLVAYRGKVVYLDFWASWCGPCKDSFPWMNLMQAKYANQGVVFIAVNVDRKKEDATRFLASTPANFIIAFDNKGTTPKDYKVMGMPSAYVIDKYGNIAHSHIGFNVKKITEYEAHIKQTLSMNVAQ